MYADTKEACEVKLRVELDRIGAAPRVIIGPDGKPPPYRRSLSSRVRFTILNRDGFRCQYCGVTPQDGARLHVDHVISLNDGGSDDDSNLVTACTDCNLGKNSRSVIR